MLKRLFDILFSLSSLILLSIVFLVIALIIKLWMSGPVFFSQERVGRNGKLFNLYKFRSMSVVKETSKGNFEIGGSLRITPLGKFLRKTKLDELPQLVNVLKGEMSIVGPRPEIKKWTEVYPSKWAIVLSVKPGITDNASIEFRNEEELLAKSDHPEIAYQKEILPKKLDLYEDYIKTRSLIGDIKIILQTIFVVITK